MSAIQKIADSLLREVVTHLSLTFEY